MRPPGLADPRTPEFDVRDRTTAGITDEFQTMRSSSEP
jgi:hypothetical protein